MYKFIYLFSYLTIYFLIYLFVHFDIGMFYTLTLLSIFNIIPSNEKDISKLLPP